MKIVSWNINGRDKTLDFVLKNSLNADLYLLQEVKVSNNLNEKNILFDQINQTDGEKRNFGNCIISFGPEINRTEINTKYKGSLIVSEIILADTKIAVINLYGILTAISKNQKTVAPNIHNMLSDLTPIFLGWSDEKFKSFILAGDFNVDKRMDTTEGMYWRKGMRTSQIIFERIEDFLLEDCLIKKYPNFVRTFRNKSGRDKVPWQIDHMFASKDLYNKLQKIEVLENTETSALSDHYPIIADFDIK